MSLSGSRMLKKPASGVLGSSKSSTYPRGYASGFDSPAALLDSLFEHPAGLYSAVMEMEKIELSPCHNSFSAGS
jgi:hypothetical protein